ncbi:MAG: DUF1080 domain-containing protein [Verrucomicrobiales bacterium]
MKTSFTITAITFTLGILANSAPDKKGAYATAKDAAEDPDFALQGEYAGSYTKGDGTVSKVGIQVIALGNGKFRAVGFEGGLPGAGWDQGERAQSEANKAADGSVTFKEQEGKATGVLKGGKMTIMSAEGAALGTLKHIERESPTLGAKAPKGAITLFDGSSLGHWKKGARKSADGMLMEGVNSARNDFKNFTMHIEFRLPYMPKARGQGRANSGMYLLGTETQMLDSFGLSGESNECGGLYKWKRPDVNMCYPPLRWQTYDVEFQAASGGNPPVTSVKHNGVTIHDKVKLRKNSSQGGIQLQNHGNPVRYRNIWLLEKS